MAAPVQGAACRDLGVMTALGCGVWEPRGDNCPDRGCHKDPPSVLHHPVFPPTAGCPPAAAGQDPARDADGWL